MIDRPFHLAIETSSRVASVTLGDSLRELGTTVLPPQQRHTVDLLPAIDALCAVHGVVRESLGTLYVSIGPGSFTGLRVGLASAKLLAEILGLRIVAVPSIDVLAMNAPGPGPVGGPGAVWESSDPTLAVCLNLKKDSVYSRSYQWRNHRWTPTSEPALRTMVEFLRPLPWPTLVLGDPLPGYSHEPGHPEPDWLVPGIRVLSAQLAVPRSQAVRMLGLLAPNTDQVTPDALLPLYVRPPEAMELWERHHGEKHQAEKQPAPPSPSAA